MNQHDLEKLKNEIGLGNVEYFATTTSTNNVAKDWVSNNVDHFSVIVANEQTKGRGRLDRRWFTAPESGLAFSVILTEGINTKYLSRYAGLGPLAVWEALSNFTEASVSIKWPNDILINQKKVGGVLVESVWIGSGLKGLIIGIGINIKKESLPPETELLFPSTYIHQYTSKTVDSYEILKQILINLKKWYPLISGEDFILVWDQNLAFRGRQVQLIMADNEIIEGRLEGIDHGGEIIISYANGEVGRFNANEIRLRPS